MEMTVIRIVLIILLTSFSAADAKTLYVDGTTGNDSTTYANNDNTHKWATLSRAVWGSTVRTSPNASQAAAAGDTVLVAAGTYHNGNASGDADWPTLLPANNGSLGSPITFQCVTAGACILTHTGTGSASGGPILGSYTGGYHTWDGFRINTINAQNHTGPSAGGILSFESTSRAGVKGITIKNFTVDSTGMTYQGGDNYPIIWASNVAGLTIQNNTFSHQHTAQGNDENVSTVTTYYCDNVLIQNNVIDNNDNGLYIKGGDNYNVTIRYNILKNNSWTMRLQYSSNVSVYQNIIYRIHYGIVTSDGLSNATIYNNTIDEGLSDPNGILWRDASISNIVTKNNIITNTNGYAIVKRFGGVFTSNYNNFYNYGAFALGEYEDYTFAGWKGLGYDANSITSNPQYVNASIRDYHLQAGSPARTASDIGGPVGAYITGNEVIGPTGYITPIPPEPTPSSGSGGGGGCSVSATGEFGSEYRIDVMTVLILLSPTLWVVGRRVLRRME